MSLCLFQVLQLTPLPTLHMLFLTLLDKLILADTTQLSLDQVMDMSRNLFFRIRCAANSFAEQLTPFPHAAQGITGWERGI
jgi:hypothetical protein